MQASAVAEIEQVIPTYFDGLCEGNADKFACAFHPCNHLYSEKDGAVADLPREDWLGAVRKRAEARPSARRPDPDIDHCLPWSAWPCVDLWNLLPAAPSVNRNSKRELIVGATKLAEAKPRILQWWQEAYLDGPQALRLRFMEEARSTLPVPAQSDALDLEDLFAALDFRRLRLRQETQIAEWHGGAKA
jgi:hypothetical protein